MGSSILNIIREIGDGACIQRLDCTISKGIVTDSFLAVYYTEEPKAIRDNSSTVEVYHEIMDALYNSHIYGTGTNARSQDNCPEIIIDYKFTSNGWKYVSRGETEYAEPDDHDKNDYEKYIIRHRGKFESMRPVEKEDICVYGDESHKYKYGNLWEYNRIEYDENGAIKYFMDQIFDIPDESRDKLTDLLLTSYEPVLIDNTKLGL